MVNAFILAGGFGTRMRPLTCSVPKSVLPVINKPLLYYMISRLVEEVPDLGSIIIGVNYRANFIKQFINEWRSELKTAVNIFIAEEKRPLGTGGAVRYSKKYLDEDSFFMLNGDVISYFSYQDMLDFHQKKKSIATIAAIHVEDVSRYGVVVADEDNQIHEFCEKPNTQELLEIYGMRPINAGTYLLEPEVFDYIEPNMKMSIEKEVFPYIVKSGRAYKYEFKNLWRDLGTPQDYLNGNFTILEEEVKRKNVENFIDDTVILADGVKIIPPVCLGENVQIGNNSEIGPNVIAGKDCEIGIGVKLKDSVLFENCWIDNFASIENVIMGDGAKAGKWARINGLGVIGNAVTIDENVMLVAKPDNPIKICPWKRITKEVIDNMKSDALFFV
ncbi:MAG: sugar phosphate nucleotidyltransferase [Candidatus Hodarchaeota archaeon]